MTHVPEEVTMGGFFKREEVVGKLVITPRAEVIGKVTDIAIGLDGRVGLNVRTKSGEEIIVTLDEVDAIEDVILLKLKKEGEVDVAKTKGKICPNCGKLNRETAKFCTNCGYPLEPESVESTAGVQDGLVGILCEIELSGISTDLKTFTTNKDSIKLGRKSLKDALAIFDRLPKAYPKGYEKKVKKQKALPLSLTIDRDEGTLFITLQFDGTYYVEVGVRALGEAIAVAPEARTDEVRELIHRFYSDPSFFKEVEEMIAEAKREQEKEREKNARSGRDLIL
ncbi:zinc ribbon domain-containing protein [Palaeococcus ferrophilus]|uniref:zinc ribbon domain-containing protein n=1 Tax=Palaeococcus ferrophilus TaxID=83868 RepID=UPI0012F80398|nr:zinc-ribbon domain-containing protein [Palaeococcus ferrophilus]